MRCKILTKYLKKKTIYTVKTCQFKNFTFSIYLKCDIEYNSPQIIPIICCFVNVIKAGALYIPFTKAKQMLTFGKFQYFVSQRLNSGTSASLRTAHTQYKNIHIVLSYIYF